MEILPEENLLVPFQSQVLVNTGVDERGRGRKEQGAGDSMDWTTVTQTHTWYSGNCLYFSNSSSHSLSLWGGRIPLTRCHRVMLSPDSVSRVIPPIITAPPTITLHPSSHTPNTLSLPEIDVGEAAASHVQKENRLRDERISTQYILVSESSLLTAHLFDLQFFPDCREVTGTRVTI